MEFHLIFIASTVFLVFAAPKIEKICGKPDDESSDCKYDCRKYCQTYGGQMDLENPTVKADIALKVNLCISKCAGNRYNPRLLLANLTKAENGINDPNWHWTSFKDIQKCLGHCAHPTPNQCLTGYLSAFLYCDCDTCCRQIEDRVKSQVCVVGCHDWFLRQWSPKKNQSCRFPGGYLETPDAWCDGFCSWKMLSKSVATIGQRCVKKCKDALERNQKIDYDLSEKSCSDPWDCLEINIHGFQITTSIEDNQIIESRRTKVRAPNKDTMTFTNTGYTVPNHITCDADFTGNQMPPTITAMLNINRDVYFESGAKDNVKALKDPFGLLPKSTIGRMIFYFHRPVQYSKFAELELKRASIKIGGTAAKCSMATSELYCNIVSKLPLEYDAILRISEEDFFVQTLKAEDIKSLVTSKYSGLKDVSVADEHSVYATATGGKITVTYSDIVKATFECKKVPGCTGGPAEPDCKCYGKSCP